ncbi:u2 small nuclear ribonucleoprotein a [Nannochloropsis oceanica]
MRITADVVLHARAFVNPVKERELDLRGLKIPLIENLGVTQDQFDTIDLCDNEIKRLDNFPRMRRIKTLLLCNNNIARIGTALGEQIPELEALVLTNNKLASLSEIDHLSSLQNLQHLSLVDNPVARTSHYRPYILHKLPNLKILDFKKIKLDERKAANKLFKSDAGKQQLADIADEGKAIASEAASKAPEKRAMTDEERRLARAMIDSATTPEELELVQRQLRAGIFKAPEPAVKQQEGAPAAATPAATSGECPTAPPSTAAFAPPMPPAAGTAPPTVQKPPPPPAPTSAALPTAPLQIPTPTPPPPPPTPVVVPAPTAAVAPLFPPPPPPSPPRPATTAAATPASVSPSKRKRTPSRRAVEEEEQEEEKQPAEQENNEEAEMTTASLTAAAAVAEAAAAAAAADAMDVDENERGEDGLTMKMVDGMKVAELKVALKERGLAITGLKAELHDRLKAHVLG